jgi:7,8-dihydropterin-6-yl-methyl-4-(beta-D-ribofuranosyl)aminobenzene 5'-phosphate synthase
VCQGPATADDVCAALPRPAAGAAAGPIALEPVDDVVVTTLVDNVYDALLSSDDTITRAPFAAGTAQTPQFETGRTNVGLIAEHGFSALVTARESAPACLTKCRMHHPYGIDCEITPRAVRPYNSWGC